MFVYYSLKIRFMSSLEKENVKINSSVLQQQVCKCEIVTNRRGSIIIYLSVSLAESFECIRK